MRPYPNPVLPGCHPDPSVCRAGEAYYLVTSSFGYFPGIPVHRSTDLVTWELVGHVLTRPEQAPLTGLDVNDGVWAATIRHHDGVFYVVATIARGRRGALSFLCTAADPAGPWSDPITLDADGIDPSLFFDDDGRCWYTAARDAADPAVTGPGELWMRELDLDALALTGPTHVLWHGALRGQWVEGPHLYRRDGRYWLLAAEGGTERNHAVTAASATAVTGPYVTDPRSPLLTHRHLGPGHPVQNVGHADLVDTPDGATWAVVLGVRPVAGTHTLGRETFLVPVTWTEAGPVLAPGAGVVPGPVPAPAAPERLDPTRPAASQGWSTLRAPADHLVRPTPEGAGLELVPSDEPIGGTGTPALLARRQQHVRFRATCALRFTPGAPGEEAGLTVLLHGDRYATLGVAPADDGTTVVRLTARTREGSTVLGEVPAPASPVGLRVTGDEDAYRFTVLDAGTERAVAEIPRPFFSTEVAGGFLGVHLGVYATRTGPPSGARATVEELVYEPEPQLEPAAPAHALAAAGR